MEIKQQLRLSQHLVMTPQLQQAIKLLQMSRFDLIENVRQEVLDNPILEELQHENANEVSLSDIQAAETVREATSGDTQSGATTQEQVTPEGEKKPNEIDWERYLEQQALQGPMPSFRPGGGDGDDMPTLDQTLTRSEDLADHLIWQLRMNEFVEDERRFGALVIGNLDGNGYLSMDDVPKEDIVPRLAAEADLDPDDAEEVLKMIQKFDPPGVAARDLRECLLVQAEVFKLDPLTVQVIDRHLPDLEKRHYAQIAKALDVAVEEIYDVAQAIAELEPRPARNYVTGDTQYITPDVYVQKIGDDYHVNANDDGMPKLRIAGFYRQAMKSDPKAKEYVQNKLRSAQWLIRSLDQRRKTIVRVTECIVEKQRPFFELGIEHLKPMILRDVADAVSMHESTISRVTSNKYVHTPRGIFELKFFFNSAIRRDNEPDIASESVKQAIKKLVSAEDTKKPLSDQELVEILAKDSIVIARRTVAKYREMLGILSSAKRKKYF